MTRESSEHVYTSDDGLELFYRRYHGVKPVPLLCLPGLTRNSRDFEMLANRLDARLCILTPDLRGRGRSSHDPDWVNYHPGTYVQDVLKLLVHARVERVSILGTSLGGIIAMLLGASGKIAVQSIVLNDIGPEVDPRGVARINRYVGASPPVNTWKEAILQVRAAYESSLPGMSDDEWAAYARRSYREDSRGMVAADMDPNIGMAARVAASRGPAPDLWRVWPALRSIPILAIRGEQSDVLSPDTLARMKREKPDLQQLIVANRGHAPTLDEPECVAGIAAFLERSDLP